jgi:hypothetical protein
MRTKIKRQNSTIINAICKSPDTSKLNALVLKLNQLKTILPQVKNLLTKVSNNTDSGGLSPRTAKHWLEKYDWYAPAPYNNIIEPNIYYSLKQFRSVYINALKNLILAIEKQINYTLPDNIREEELILQKLETEYNNCLNIPIEDISNDERLQPTPTETTETTQEQNFDLSKYYLPLGIAIGGYLLYKTTNKKRKK